jgi:tetraacyldisaccharide 4'-kinase
MILLRKLLFPFAIVYGFITFLRNYLYDKGILKSYTFDIPIIAVGNLNVGGTGKTPQIEYLIRLLSAKYRVATLSRGYKRKSKGFVLANETSNAEVLGDEPFQYYSKFQTIQVAVDADRKNGIEQLLNQPSVPEIILLDDAFQHRKVKAGFYILLTSYDELFCDDFMLPTGNLRESRSGAKRANVIIVTKCPSSLTETDQEKIKKAINLEVPIFFSYVSYDDTIYNDTESLLVSKVKSESKVLLAGIAKPKPFFKYLMSEADEIMTFSDHHHFSAKDIDTIKNKAKDRIIITTEKDFVRLKAKVLKKQLFYLPIKSQMVANQDAFNQTIINYVGAYSRNC